MRHTQDFHKMRKAIPKKKLWVRVLHNGGLSDGFSGISCSVYDKKSKSLYFSPNLNHVHERRVPELFMSGGYLRGLLFSPGAEVKQESVKRTALKLALYYEAFPCRI